MGQRGCVLVWGGTPVAVLWMGVAVNLVVHTTLGAPIKHGNRSGLSLPKGTSKPRRASNCMTCTTLPSRGVYMLEMTEGMRNIIKADAREGMQSKREGVE